MSDKLIEKRKHPRIKAQLKIAFFNEEGHREEHLTDNISMSGTCIEGCSLMAVGDEREYFISLPDGSNEFTMLGRVVNHQPRGPENAAGLGVHFLLIEPQQKEAYDQFVQVLLEQKGLGTRKHPRVASIFDVNLNVDGQIRDEQVYDISRGGIGILTSDPIALGHLIGIQFRDESRPDEMLELKGEIRSSVRLSADMYRLGLRFVDLQPGDLKQLKQYIISMTRSNKQS